MRAKDYSQSNCYSFIALCTDNHSIVVIIVHVDKLKRKICLSGDSQILASNIVSECTN